MAYIETDGNWHIVSPVSIYDVQQSLEANDNDLATLCMKNNVNMWSIGKPVYFAKIPPLTNSDLRTGRTISGYSTSYGIKKRASKVWSDYMDANGAVKSEPWQYDKPLVDGVNVFRLSDFNNYWHDAQPAIILTLPDKEKVFVPTNNVEEGETLNYSINSKFWLFDEGAIPLPELFAACSNYYPSVILTCYYSNTTWIYAKSAQKQGGGYWTIGEIGGGSGQSGCTISVDTKDLAAAMVHDGARYEADCLINGRQWEACMVLLDEPRAGDVTAHSVINDDPTNNKIIVRLEYLAGVDRNTFTISSGKFRYISAMSATVKLKRDTNNITWWHIDSISVTATKETADQMTFTINALLTCAVGVVGASGVPESQSVNVNFNSTTFAAQTGNVTNSLPTAILNSVTYKPERAIDPENHSVCACTLTFHNTHGDWDGSFNFYVPVSGSGPSEYTLTLPLQ